jgi:G3E family GTPase
MKNEFGDVEVDSHLASMQNVAGVREMLNGCLCCVLVGQMKEAIRELRDTFHPDRIIVETYDATDFPFTGIPLIIQIPR